MLIYIDIEVDYMIYREEKKKFNVHDKIDLIVLNKLRPTIK